MDVHEIRKRVLPIVLVAVVIGAGWWWWSTRGGGAAASQDVLGGTGTIEAVQVAVTPQTAGRIVELTAEEGAAVNRRDVLYRLDDTLAKLQVTQAQAGVDAAKANYKHVRADNNSNKAERAAAKAQYDQAKAALKMAMVQLSYTTITSPLDGTLASIAARPGENAVPGSTLAMVSDTSSLTVTVFVPESLIGQVTVGQPGVVTTDSTARDYDGEVVFVATKAEFAPSTLETKDQRVKLVYQVKLKIKNADENLKPGMPADVVLK
jgi:HlyD family secretion protein